MNLDHDETKISEGVQMDRKALARLKRSLEKASDMFANGDRREGAAKALIAVQTYISRVFPHDSSDILRPLAELSAALMDATQGLRNPLTFPAKLVGGRKTLHIERMNLAIAAATVTLFLEAGFRLHEAAHIVSRKMPQMTPKTLIEARKNIMQKRAKDDVLSAGYDFWLERGRSLPPKRIEKAEQILSILKDRLGKA